MSKILIDSYPESNYNYSYSLYSGSATQHIAQSFQNPTETELDSCKFYLTKSGSPTGNMTASIYALTGTYGVDEKPTGSALATSDPVDSAGLSTTRALIEFTFSGANRITLNASTNYAVVISYTGGNAVNKITVGVDNTSPTHNGALSTSQNASTWSRGSYDTIFYIYKEQRIKILTIAGEDYLPYYKTNTAVIKETLRKTNVMNLEIVTKGIADAPQEGAEIIFKDDTRFLFGGYISRVQPSEVGKGDLFNFKVEASDYAYIFNSKVARRAYSNKTLLYIVTDLMGEYVDASYGYDLTNVATGPTIDTVSFDHISIRKCFEKLAKLTGYVWWVDYEKKLYFQTQTATVAPETVTDSSDNIDSVNISFDTSQVRNSVIVIGDPNGVESLNLVSEHFEGDGETRSWPLANKPSTVSSILWNSVSKQFSLDVNERDTDVFTYSFTGQSFKLTEAQTTPSAGDDIDISYYPRIPIIVQLTDPASIAFFSALDGGDGVYEYTIKESSIGSIEEATLRAQQELNEYSMPLVDGTITTRSGLLSEGSIFKPGQVLTINMPTQGLSSDTAFLIQEVNIEVLDGSSMEYIYTIRFGGKIIGVQQFLEDLAADQSESEDTTDSTEIFTIEHVTDQMEFSDSDVAISHTTQTPPYKWGSSSSPKFVWGLSEWS